MDYEYYLNRYVEDEERAEELYKKCSVTNLSIKLREGFRSYDALIDAVVEDNGKEYYVSFTVYSYRSIDSISCSCEEGKRSYYPYNYYKCEHFGAVLLVLKDLYNIFGAAINYNFKKGNPNKSFSVYEKQIKELNVKLLENETLLWTNKIKSIYSESFNIKYDNPAKIIAVFENKHTPQIKFKIGEDKMYVIKNIYNFLNNIKFNKEISYSKYFTWQHNENNLDEPSLKIVSFLRKYYNYDSDDTRNDYMGIKSNAIEFNALTFDNLYNLLDSLPSEYRNINTFENDTQFNFEIKEDDMGYIIELTDSIDNFIFTKNYAYELVDNNIFKIKLDDNTILSRLMGMMIENYQSIRISKDQINEFYQFVLKPILKYINLETSLDLNELNDNEDTIEIYGDINEDALAYFQIYACYEDNKENILENKEKVYSPTINLIKDYFINYEGEIHNNSIFFDIENTKTKELLNKGIVFLEKHANVYVSDKLRRIGEKSKFKISVGVSVSDGLLALDFDSIDIPKEELAEVLNSYHSKKKYHKLKSGEVIHIESEELEEIDDLMNQYKITTKDIDNGHVELNANRAYAMNLSMDKVNTLDVTREKSFKGIVDRLSDYKAHKYELNKGYDDILRSYQKEGYQWLSTLSHLKLGGILADDMGLGKTLQIISLLDNNKKHFSIVVCPSSLVLNWIDEFNKFSKNYNAIAVMGNVEERKEIIKNAKEYDTLVTSYDYLRRDITLYNKLKFDFIILDEAQYIKNHQTQNAKAVKKLKGKQRFALTGTPIENSLAELWSIFDFLEKDYLFNYTYFKKQYETPIVKNKDLEAQEELRQLISPFVLRRTKKEVLKELPEKVENTVKVEFNEEEKKLYLAHLAKANKELQMLTGNSNRVQILAMLTKLRQICCEPRVAFENINTISSKMQVCLDLIHQYKDNHKKIIVFSSFTSILDLIAQELDKTDIKYHVLTGATNKIKRKQYVDNFQSDDSTVFLISLKAGGTGLNLTAAEGIIHFDPWWNMSAQSQATDRAHRIGQKNTVFVYKLIVSNTIEEKIQELQNRKKDLADTFVENNDGSITTMTSEEIIDLFK